MKGSTDTPQEALVGIPSTLEPHEFIRGSMSGWALD